MYTIHNFTPVNFATFLMFQTGLEMDLIAFLLCLHRMYNIFEDAYFVTRLLSNNFVLVKVTWNPQYTLAGIVTLYIAHTYTLGKLLSQSTFWGMVGKPDSKDSYR